MKRLHIAKADETNITIENIDIAIDETLPEDSEQLEDKFDYDSMALAQTLIKVLPQGTLIRLTSRLLAHEAGKNFLKIPSGT